MITNERLLEFYLEQYGSAFSRHAGMRNVGKHVSKLNSRINLLKKIQAYPGQENRIQYEHKIAKKIIFAVYSTKNRMAKQRVKKELIPEIMRLDLELMPIEDYERLDETILQKIKKEEDGNLCNIPLGEIYRKILKKELKQEIISIVPSRPEMEFPKALEMERRFVLHVGPTNSGKTYQSLLRLEQAQHGVYLGPLRLLALEVYEKMMERKVPCTMLTGQECIEEENSRVTASTIEMLDIAQEYDIAVVDEAQMIADEVRGHFWTRTILGIRAKEIHICMSEDALEVVEHLIGLCNDQYEVLHYERKTPLVLEKEPFLFPRDVKNGDALIVFSKKAVLNVAARLEEKGIHSSVIYGSLPPEIRRRQVHMFNEGKTQVVVSTDAIGMGINLPVRRIVFMEVEKYDGKQQRALTISEIKQIAGRAGRFELYDTGYVNALEEGRLRFLERHFYKSIPKMEKVSLGFPQILLNMDAPLDMIIQMWHKVKPLDPFEKISIEDMLFLYEEANKRRYTIPDFENKHILYRMITCPVDIKDYEVVNLWSRYCTSYLADVELEKPSHKSRYFGLAEYESYYKKLDLYYQFSTRMGKWVDMEWLEKEREKTQDKIMQLLSEDKKEYIFRCKYCGRVLPVGSHNRICFECMSWY